MEDLKTLEKIKLLHPKLRDEALEIYKEICKEVKHPVLCRFTHTLRTPAEQDALYAQGRTKPGKIVTNAKSLSSMHNYGLAIDIVLLMDKNNDWKYETVSYDTKIDADRDGKSDWMEIVRIFKEFGWEWGGDWKFYDAPHFQKTFGYSIRQLKDLYISGKVDKNNYVLI
jgi:peptidoglycan L-alanyl-D-glutamate endopeptidase CwlK